MLLHNVYIIRKTELQDQFKRFAHVNVVDYTYDV